MLQLMQKMTKSLDCERSGSVVIQLCLSICLRERFDNCRVYF